MNWEYIGDQPEEARYEQRGDEDARSSLVKAYDKLLAFQAARSPPPSSSSSTTGSQTGNYGGPVDHIENEHGPYNSSLGVGNLSPKTALGGKSKQKVNGQQARENAGENGAKWEALSQPDYKVAVKIGDIPVVCKDLCVSTLFVGSHAVSSHIRSDWYDKSTTALQQGPIRVMLQGEQRIDKDRDYVMAINTTQANLQKLTQKRGDDKKQMQMQKLACNYQILGQSQGPNEVDAQQPSHNFSCEKNSKGPCQKSDSGGKWAIKGKKKICQTFITS